MRPLHLNGRSLLVWAHDVAMAGLAFGIALWLRLGDRLADWPLAPTLVALALFMGSCAIIFYATGLHRNVWRYASMADLLLLARAATGAVLLFTVLAFALTRLEGVPRSVPIIAWLVLLALLGGARIGVRLLREGRFQWQRAAHQSPVLLLGAGPEAEQFIRAMESDPHAPYRVIGVLDDRGRRTGRKLRTAEILGGLMDLPDILHELRARQLAPAKLLLTRPLNRLLGVDTEQLLAVAQEAGIPVARLPGLTEFQQTGTSLPAPRPIALEDLLGRPEVALNREQIGALIRDRRVLVTGAGGTIGGELSQQIAALAPAALTLIDLNEYQLYEIDRRLRTAHPALALVARLGDVRDEAAMRRLMAEQQPELVFHAAALKHVPIVEAQPLEGIHTNLLGTRHVAEAAAACGVTTFIMISTDKAVRASSVMGATKRAAEMLCQMLDAQHGQTRFMAVRFGNVLGSTGSVVPLFREQIARGGPVTVTHPDMTRYFMSVREAVELVLQASALATTDQARGQVMVLDMGAPVRILDLARQMIRLAGLVPEQDIAITITGLRPGEKLSEELFSAAEALLPSSAAGIQLAAPPVPDPARLSRQLAQIAASIAAGGPDAEALRLLAEIVTDFQQQRAA